MQLAVRPGDPAEFPSGGQVPQAQRAVFSRGGQQPAVRTDRQVDPAGHVGQQGRGDGLSKVAMLWQLAELCPARHVPEVDRAFLTTRSHYLAVGRKSKPRDSCWL